MVSEDAVDVDQCRFKSVYDCYISKSINHLLYKYILYRPIAYESES